MSAASAKSSQHEHVFLKRFGDLYHKLEVKNSLVSKQKHYRTAKNK